jgi:tetraacyldisaccharide 4'-kinase
MRAKLFNFWQKRNFLTLLLLPFSWLFIVITRIRFWYYRFLGQQSFNVPVIVVGNITLGGTGKTPLVIHLAHFLAEQGYRPGIVLRGYKSSLKQHQVMRVYAHSDPSITGDESVLLAHKTGCPVMIGQNRCAGIAHLLDTCPQVNIVLSDDGLQHYRMGREIEIIVLDGERRLGNGFCLPAGPLREAPARLKHVDFIVANGKAATGEWSMLCKINHAVHFRTGEIKSLHDFTNQQLHVFAAIGSPHRFFSMLESFGIAIITHVFPDHYVFKEQDFASYSEPILLTEKDIVKCNNIQHDNLWYVPLTVAMPAGFTQALLGRIQSGQETVRNPGLPHLQEGLNLQKGKE